MINKITTPIIILCTSILASCGGGSSTIDNQNTPNSPTQVTENNWQNTQLFSRATNQALQIETSGSALTIKVLDNGVNRGKHTQIYLDIDNNPATGFTFDNEAWVQSGVDYIIEDGHLFRSTANNSDWSWDTDVGEISFSRNATSIDISIETSLLQGLCNTLNAGAMARDDNWDIQSFYPTSSRMKKYSVDTCSTGNDTVPPVITLNGANPLKLSVNATYTDPGAIATDNVDGIITSRIIATPQTVDTSSVGILFVEYKVSDSAGNTTSVKRKVIIDQATPQGIVIDGNPDDWAAIEPLSQTTHGTLKVFDDANKLYFLIESNAIGSNTQLFLDSDNNASTGFQLGDQAWVGGADYMIENRATGKSTSNTPQWAWDFNISTSTEYAKTNNVVEIGILKTDIASLNNPFKLGFMSRNDNWDINYLLPEDQLLSYQFQNSDPVNNAPIAQNDSAITTGTEPVTINVLENDNDTDGDPLTVMAVSSPSNGLASIVNNAILYTANNGFSGNDTFTYTISDGRGGNSTATVSISVDTDTVPNRAPDAVEDAPSTDHTQAITIAVLDNDTDPDGDTLTVTAVTQPPLGQTTLNDNGTILFDPQGNIGSISFSYTISDGRGGTDSTVVTVASSDPNDGNDNFPVITGENVTTTLNTAIFIDVLANDTDADGDTLILDQVDQGAHGITTKVNGGVLYTPAPGFTGTDSFFYGVHDGHGHNGAGLVTITVTLPRPQ